MLASLIIIIASGVAATTASSVLSRGAFMSTSGEAKDNNRWQLRMKFSGNGKNGLLDEKSIAILRGSIPC